MSRPLRDADKRIRLVQIEDGPSVRFSDPVDVEPGDGEMRFLPNVPMHDAVSPSGSLSNTEQLVAARNGEDVTCRWPDDSDLKTDAEGRATLPNMRANASSSGQETTCSIKIAIGNASG